MISHIHPRVIFEIGVGNPSISRSIRYMGDPSVRIEMFEPNAQTFRDLQRAFGGVPNVTLHNVALCDRDGEIEFCEDGDSSYISNVVSPTVFNAPPEYVASRKRVMVPCRTIAHYDRGDIDIALIDTEGSEWKIVSHMVSRPKLLVLETENGPYRTPNLDQMTLWLAQNGYKLHKQDLGDSWYVLDR